MNALPFTDLMPITPDWGDIALRLTVTLIACTVIGINRERGGHAAGLRTTVLVGIAACVSMIQANMLLSTSQDVNGSMDVLRFPLGVLTGVGFIGGGAILRRGDVATGVTTAATLWFVTAVGICFGGGQLIIGTIATVVALIILSPFKHLGQSLRRDQKGSVGIRVARSKPIPDIAPALPADVESHFTTVTVLNDKEHEVIFELRWKAASATATAVDIANALRSQFSVTRFDHRETLT